MSAKPSGYIIYRGPSLLDGAPIVAIATTGRSTNTKTGPMVQSYILRSDIAPLLALASGADVSICGDCKHRPFKGGGCYVQVGRAPEAVYGAYTRGRYPSAVDVAAVGEGRPVRIGTYGDPAAVPTYVWRLLVQRATMRTGYTHQWGVGGSLLDLCMASVDSERERDAARAAGWRTFRVMSPGQAPGLGEFSCPASAEAGKRVQCIHCGACDGRTRSARQTSPVIIAHGSRAGRFDMTRAAVSI